MMEMPAQQVILTLYPGLLALIAHCDCVQRTNATVGFARGQPLSAVLEINATLESAITQPAATCLLLQMEPHALTATPAQSVSNSFLLLLGHIQPKLNLF